MTKNVTGCGIAHARRALHHPRRIDGSKAEAFVEPVGISCPEDEPEAREVGMGEHRREFSIPRSTTSRAMPGDQ
jgi:hypothetical protein